MKNKTVKAQAVKDKLVMKLFLSNSLRERIAWEESNDALNEITKRNTIQEVVSSLVAYAAMSTPIIFPQYYFDEADDAVFVTVTVATIVILAFGIFMFTQSMVVNKAIRARRREISLNRAAKAKEAREQGNV